MQDRKRIDPRAEKARMLVSLLGADFTKNSAHPFFRQVSQTATATNLDGGSSEKMDAALTGLIDALQKKPSDLVKTAPASKSDAETINQSKPASQTIEIATQHPALIALHLRNMAVEDQRVLLKALPRSVARQVTIYSLRLDDTKDANRY